MQYIIGYTVEERRCGVLLSGAAETWTLDELCEMGLNRLVECALDHFDGPDKAQGPMPVWLMGDSELKVTAHRVLPIV